MLEANLAAFRQRCPDLIATIVSRNPAWTATRHAVRSIAPIGFATGAASDDTRNVLLERLLENLEADVARDEWEREVIAVMAAADGVVVSGGGNLSATWPEHVYQRAAFAEMAYRLGKPVVFLGQTIGPDLSPVIESLLARTLRRALVVGVRELCSASLALSLGVSPRCLIYQTDDALFLDETPVEDAWAKPLRRGGRPWIAVTIDPFAVAEDAAPAIDALAAQLSRLVTYTGAQLVFVPHVASANGEPSVGADLVVGHAIRDRLPASTSMVMCDVLEASKTRWLTGQADLIVSTRYHPLVFGMAAAIPGLGIFTDEYRRVKLQGALAHANLANCCVSLQQVVEEDRLFEMARSLWDRREELRRDLLARNVIWRDQETFRWRTIFAALGLPDANDSHHHEASPNAETNKGFVAHPLVRRLLDELEARRQSMVSEQAEALRRFTHAERYAQSLLAEQITLKAMSAESERSARSLEAENRQLKAMCAESEQYAHSLQAENRQLKAMSAESERYARSLEAENRQLTERFGEVERYALSLEDALKTSKHIGIDSKDGNQNERGPR
jgi:polysaccharide pyruvyl transferase WcaK-like protein